MLLCKSNACVTARTGLLSGVLDCIKFRVSFCDLVTVHKVLEGLTLMLPLLVLPQYVTNKQHNMLGSDVCNIVTLCFQHMRMPSWFSFFTQSFVEVPRCHSAWMDRLPHVEIDVVCTNRYCLRHETAPCPTAPAKITWSGTDVTS